MCFSAGASFGAAAVLCTAGVVSLKKARDTSQLTFASIPFLFGVQQATEGVLWLSLSHSTGNSWSTISTYIFLFFAQLLWPVLIPSALAQIETSRVRKKVLRILSVAGFFTAALLAYRLINYKVSAEIREHHIYYDVYSPHLLVIANSILYITSIVLPFFVSGIKRMPVLGILLVMSLLLTKIFYESYLISVWCFFAALLSAGVIHIVQNFQKNRLPNMPQAHDLKMY